MKADQVNEVIETVAEKLGIAIEQIYPELSKQATVYCNVYTVVLWIFGISCIALLVSLIGISIFTDRYSDVATGFLIGSIAVAILSGITFLISGIWALGSLASYQTALNNPEWWVIEYVLNMIG